MEDQNAVTMVRLYLPQEGHSARKTQMERVLHFLRDQLNVHEVTILTGLMEAQERHKPHYETVGDVLRRNPDPPAVIEFFCESELTTSIWKKLFELVPDGEMVHWKANCVKAPS